MIAADECYSEIYQDEQSPPAGLLQAAASLGRHGFDRGEQAGRELERNAGLGELALPDGTALLVDDYGHHPTEVRATLESARSAGFTRLSADGTSQDGGRRLRSAGLDGADDVNAAGAGVVVARGLDQAADWRGVLLLQAANLCFAFGQLRYGRLRERAGVGEPALLGWMYLGATLFAFAASGVRNLQGADLEETTFLLSVSANGRPHPP